MLASLPICSFLHPLIRSLSVAAALQADGSPSSAHAKQEEGGSPSKDNSSSSSSNSGSGSGSVAQRARHVDDLLRGDSEWDVDIHYYLSQQVRAGEERERGEATSEAVAISVAANAYW